MNLKDKLKDYHSKSVARTSDDIKETMAYAANKLAKDRLNDKAIAVGDVIPDFILESGLEGQVNSKDLLSKGPMIINYYRGGWWPYCLIELDSYQELIERYKDKNTTFVSICPEKVSYIKKVYEKKNYDFHILSDTNNEYAKKLGIIFKLEDNLSVLYKKFGIDLMTTQGNEHDELPIPVTIVINKNGIVEMIHLETDYTKRYEPRDTLNYL